MSLFSNIVFHLVDDNDIDIAVNMKLLQIVKLTESIHTYGGGQKFLSEVDAYGEKFNGHHNIILLDIMMPVINGFDCLEHLHKLPEERRKHFSVYMLSSTIDRNDIMRAEAYPLVKKVLEKPLDVYLLKKSVQELVEEIG